MRKMVGSLITAAVLFLLSGCCPSRTCVEPGAAVPRVSPWSAPTLAPLRTQTGEALSEAMRASVSRAGPKPMNVLILSGGGQYGAFGAGFLNGLAARPDQPDLSFDIVTGISTGSLQATFAFLGPEFYGLIEEAYTGVTQEDIIRERNPVSLLCASSIMDASPLRALIERYITMEVLNKVAEAHEGGRQLYIGTVNLDTGEFVPWNMGQIASTRTEEALHLYHDILMAATAIPVVFPPVLLSQDAASGAGSESLHTDGGVRETVFFRQFMLELKKAVEVERRRSGPGRQIAGLNQAIMTVIVNGKLGIAYECTQERFISVGLRSLSALTDQSSLNSVFRAYALACANGISFRMTRIPDDFEVPANSWTFDTEAMKALFDLGKDMALSEPIPWETRPPTGEDIDALCGETR
jgi:hypothetical protein